MLTAQNAKTISEDALFGNDPEERIVCAEPDPDGGIFIFRRTDAGVHKHEIDFKPWLLLTETPSFPLADAEYSCLEGEGCRILAEFENVRAWQIARSRVRNENLPCFSYPSLVKSALVRMGKTLFKGMVFEDIYRIQFDLETNGLSPDHPENRILLIVVSDNRGMLELLEGDEREIIENFCKLVSEHDPDVLEGHNIFGFDLPFLISRAKQCGVHLSLGRDGSDPKIAAERNFAIGGRTRPFLPYHIYGRHLLDTYLIVQRFDWAKGELSSYGLKECARTYGFAGEDRVEIPGAEIPRIYNENPDLVRMYARQDAEDTRSLADLITPVEFYQTQMVPDNYDNCVITGTGEKINSLFVRAYLASGRSVPIPRSAQANLGGYTALLRTGVLERIVKADVESLYPSLMLTHKIAPESDTLEIFLPMLRTLTERRLEAKKKASGSAYWDGIQNTFKVFINSFYGYLGGPFPWNDYKAAGRITEFGREIVQKVAAELEETGSEVIEIDTDGVYFVPPEEVSGEADEQQYVAKIAKVLPDGVRLAFDGRYEKMLSLKMKNYVLQDYGGKRIFRGASLRSRADERYGRRFLAETVDRIMERDFDGAAELYAKYANDILERRIPIEDLSRRERVTHKTFNSELKQRNARVAVGVPVGDYLQVYERNDGSLGLVEDFANDENVKYYLDKLYKFARRLENAFDGKFSDYILKPTSSGVGERAQQAMDFL